MKNKETENFNNSNIKTETPSPKEQYNIILKLYKGLHENLEELYKKSKDKTPMVFPHAAFDFDTPGPWNTYKNSKNNERTMFCLWRFFS